MATVKANTTLVITPKNGATYDLTFGGITQYGRTSGDTIGVFPVDKEYTLVKYGDVEVYALDQFGVKSYEAGELPDPASLPVGQVVAVGGNPSIADESNVIPVSPSRFRFKEKPQPSEYIGMAIITDIGDPYSVWFSDGMNWKPYAGSLVIEQAHQSGNAMTGSGAGGTSDLGFGLSSTYSVFPLGKQFDLLAGIIGNHGSVRVKAKFTATNNANTHEVGLGAGLKYTTPVFLASSAGATWDTKIIEVTISNRGSETSKTVTTRTTTINAGTVTESVTSSTSTLDTSIDQKLWFYGCLRGNSADTITLESFSVELLRA